MYGQTAHSFLGTATMLFGGFDMEVDAKKRDVVKQFCIRTLYIKHKDNFSDRGFDVVVGGDIFFYHILPEVGVGVAFEFHNAIGKT